jgi:hypothetical protein
MKNVATMMALVRFLFNVMTPFPVPSKLFGLAASGRQTFPLGAAL